MRTTITLDEDVAVELDEFQAEKELSFKEAVNLTVRAGLRTLKAPQREARPRYQTPSFDLGSSLIGSLDDISEVLAIAEGDDYR